MKFFIVLLVVLGIFGFFASGLRLHPENVPYYLKLKSNAGLQEVRLKNGETVTGIIEEEADSKIRINMDGATLSFDRSEIDSVGGSSGEGTLGQIRHNYEVNRKKHPLITQDKKKTLGAAWDNFVMEPSRLADEIKRKNPGISMTDRMNEAMADAARARQAMAKQQQAMEQEMQAEGGASSSSSFPSGQS